jgi:hypothetical protein
VSRLLQQARTLPHSGVDEHLPIRRGFRLRSRLRKGDGSNHQAAPGALSRSISSSIAMLTVVAGEPVSPESTMMDASVQFASEWGATKFDRAVEIVTAMVTKLGRRSLIWLSAQSRASYRTCIRCSLIYSLTRLPLPPPQRRWGRRRPRPGPPLPRPQRCSISPHCDNARGQIAAWRPDLDAATAQRIATAWMNEAGAKRLASLFATVAPRKRSGAFKFDWIEDLVAHPRPLRPARRQAQSSSS